MALRNDKFPAFLSPLFRYILVGIWSLVHKLISVIEIALILVFLLGLLLVNWDGDGVRHSQVTMDRAIDLTVFFILLNWTNNLISECMTGITSPLVLVSPSLVQSNQLLYISWCPNPKHLEIYRFFPCHYHLLNC